MDSIADMLTTILNAQRVGKKRVAVPYSTYKQSLLELLQKKGLVAKVRVQDEPSSKLLVTLAYGEDGTPAITGARRISKPGRRVYSPKRAIPYTFSGIGMIVVSTSKGLMDEHEARKGGIGGELICAVW